MTDALRFWLLANFGWELHGWGDWEIQF